MPVIREAHGLRWVDHGPELSDDILAFSGHEEGLRPIIKSLLPEGGVFIDVGAHVGLWSLTMAERASHVYAFEANPLTYATLVNNIEMNGLSSKVTAINAALWDANTRVHIKDWHGKISGGSTACFEGGEIPAVTLVEWVEKTHPERIDLIKIDTEGAEARVLMGAILTLQVFQPHLLLEMHGGIQDVSLDVDAEVYSILKYVNYETSDEFMVSGGRRMTASPYTPWKEGERV